MSDSITDAVEYALELVRDEELPLAIAIATACAERDVSHEDVLERLSARVNVQRRLDSLR